MAFPRLSQFTSRSSLSIFAGVLLVAGLGIAVLGAQQQQDQRSKASESNTIVLANSIDDFSSVQGTKGWRYGFSNGNYNGSNFQEMPGFTSGSWVVDVNRYFIQISALGMHPNGTVTSHPRTPALMWPVRRWVSTTSGPVTIAGNFIDVDPTNSGAGEDGITTAIYIDGQQVWANSINNGGSAEFTITKNVSVGTKIDFTVGPANNDYNDTTGFKAVITKDAGPIAVPTVPPGYTEFLPYLSGEYRYKQVTHNGILGFEQPNFDDSSFLTGSAGFGTQGGGCAVNQSTNRKTNWAPSTDMLVRRHFNIPTGASDVKIDVALDDTMRLYLNGHELINWGTRSDNGQGNCGSYSNYTVSVPQAYIIAGGDNLIAVRGIDNGVEAYLDVRVYGKVGGPECTTNEQCTNGKICVNNSCIVPECTTNAQCSNGFVCTNNKCVAPVPECTTNADCTGGKICLSNKCVTPPSSGITKLKLTLFMHGIGKAGDNASPGEAGGGNKNLVHLQRRVMVELTDLDGQVFVEDKEGLVTYQTTPGNFQGDVDIALTDVKEELRQSFTTGSYIVKVKLDQSLQEKLPKNIIVGGTTNVTTSLVNGNINNDNAINIIDYNILRGCFNEFEPASDCDQTRKIMSDLDDDGIVGSYDITLFLREMSVYYR